MENLENNYSFIIRIYRIFIDNRHEKYLHMFFLFFVINKLQ